jgi:hypothetical protein
MFAVTPYPAFREVAKVSANGSTTIKREPCRVVGIDTSGGVPRYVVEVRAASGDHYLEFSDTIRKPEPGAPI